ncbi:MAG: hypothetical protein Q8907_11435 [Bacteroidota bacterium]|nr:hypothetical protein [Bacteroidota bacterium]
MVRGLVKFKEYFAGFGDNYIIIGGTACDILEEEAGQQPRATKDIDIILIIEALAPEFVKQFWEFVKAGDYETRERSNGENEYFRFMKPRVKGFPVQIEIFSRKPDILQIAEDSHLTPIPVDEELSSLSAILMNDEYYQFTIEHSDLTDNVHLARVESLICLKAKAYLDLNKRRRQGEQIDEKNIRKHKNDIFRLATMLNEGDTFVLPESMKADLNSFCQEIQDSLPDKIFFKAIGLLGITPEEVYRQLCNVFK